MVNGDGEKYRNLVLFRDLDDAPERRVCRVAEDLDRVHLATDERRRRAAAFADAAHRYRHDLQVGVSPGLRHLVLHLDGIGSSGLKRIPTRRAFGTVRLMRSIRVSCSGSPKPGE